MTSSSSDPAELRFKCLFGTKPGQLDSTQLARVLVAPGYTLSFASLEPDPLGRDMGSAACTEADGKHRVAIEDPPTGAGTPRYRLVPNAELAQGVQNEGRIWPRIVNICGEFVVCSQDQWYIYKLDPAYSCYVPLHPRPPVISRREPDPRNHNGKRPHRDASAELEDLRKRFRTTLSFDQGPCTEAPDGSSPGLEDPEPIQVDEPSQSHPTPSPDINMETPPHDRPSSSQDAEDGNAGVSAHPSAQREDRDEPAPHSGNSNAGPSTDNLSGGGPLAASTLAPQPEIVDTAMEEVEGNPVEASGAGSSPQNPFKASASPTQPDIVDLTMEDAEPGSPEYHAKRKYDDQDEPTSSPKRARTTRMEPQMSPADKRAAERTARRRTTRLAEKEKRKQEERWRREDALWADILNTTPARPSARYASTSAVPPPRASPTAAPQASSSSPPSGSTTSASARRTTSTSSSSSSTASASISSASQTSTSQTSTSQTSTSQTSTSQTSTSQTSTSQTSTSQTSTLSDEATREDLEHKAFIEESRRKIAELEKDKPLWAEERKKREAEEARVAEEMARRSKRMEREREAGTAAGGVKGKATRPKEMGREGEAGTAAGGVEERTRFLKAQASEERSKLRRRYSGKFWDIRNALQHFSSAGETFDSTKYTVENPVVFEKIPWPTLLPPWKLREDDITWEQVEMFFKHAHLHMSLKDYKDFVEKAHRRFHPDRWRARQLIKSIGDQEWAEQLDAVANVATQAITPIWRHSQTLRASDARRR